MHYKGLTVELMNIADEAFIEYKDPKDYPDTKALSQAFIEIPEDGEDQTFYPRYAADGRAELFPKEDMSLSFYLSFQKDVALDPNDPEPVTLDIPAEGRKGERVENYKEGYPVGYDFDTYEWILQKFAFNKLKLCGKSTMEKTDLSYLEGVVEIHVWQVCNTREEYARGWSKGVNTMKTTKKLKTVSQRDLKGKDVSHDVTVSATKRKYVRCEYVQSPNFWTEEPFHTFRFHYRTRDVLISRGLIETPEIETIIRAMKTETMYQRKRMEALEAKLANLKRKRRDDSPDTPEANSDFDEIESSSQDCENGGEDDIEIVLPPSKKKGFTVNLTAREVLRKVQSTRPYTSHA